MHLRQEPSIGIKEEILRRCRRTLVSPAQPFYRERILRSGAGVVDDRTPQALHFQAERIHA